MEKCSKNVKIISFMTVLGILHKIKENLGQEHIKRDFYLSREKISRISSDFPGKMIVFPVLTLLFHLYLSKIWLSHKNYISEMSGNKAISRKSFIRLSLRLWIW